VLQGQETLLHLAAKRFVVGSLQYLIQQKDVHVDQLDGEKVRRAAPPPRGPRDAVRIRPGPGRACGAQLVWGWPGGQSYMPAPGFQQLAGHPRC
jgi:hypothetical protein